MSTAFTEHPIYKMTRVSDPQTSHDAAETVRAATIRAQVYTVLREHPAGLTSDEVITRYRIAFMSPATDQGIRSRLPELERDKLAVKTSETRPSATGRKAHVWKVRS